MTAYVYQPGRQRMNLQRKKEMSLKQKSLISWIKEKNITNEKEFPRERFYYTQTQKGLLGLRRGTACNLRIT